MGNFVQFGKGFSDIAKKVWELILGQWTLIEKALISFIRSIDQKFPFPIPGIATLNYKI